MLAWAWSFVLCFFFSSRRRHTRSLRDWSSDVCSSDLFGRNGEIRRAEEAHRCRRGRPDAGGCARGDRDRSAPARRLRPARLHGCTACDPDARLFLAARGERVAGGVIVEAGLRSGREDRWREAYEKAGSGELEALRNVDPELVDEDSAALGAALGRVLDALADGGRALIVGHSPTNEAAVFGLTGQIVSPISKGAGVLLVDDQGFRLETLD